MSSAILVSALLLHSILLADDLYALKAVAEESDELILDVEECTTGQGPCAYYLLLDGALENEEFDLFVCDTTLTSHYELSCYAQHGHIYNIESGSEVLAPIKRAMLGEPIHFMLRSRCRECAATAFVVPMPLEVENHQGYKLSALLVAMDPAGFHVTGSGFAPEEVVTMTFTSGSQYRREALKATIDGEVSTGIVPCSSGQTSGHWSVKLWGRKGSICLRGPWGKALQQTTEAYLKECLTRSKRL